MKRSILSLMLFISLAASAQNKWDQTPYDTKSFANQSLTKVESSTSGGNIYVSSVAASEIKVEVFIQASNSKNTVSKDEIASRLKEHYDLDVSVSGGTLKAIAKNRTRNMDWRNSLSISFKIYVPRNISSKLTTSGGNIKLSSLSGTQDFTTSGGNLELNDLKGKLIGTTSGGNVNVSNSDNDINLTTSGGNITAENCTGKINLTTSGGSVKLTRLNGDIEAATSGGNVHANSIAGDLDAHTSGGNVDLADLSCSVDASTSGGDIKVSVKEYSKYVKLTNSGGSIDLILPQGTGLDLKLYGDKVKTDDLKTFNGKIKEDEVSGKLNGGGVLISANAGSGRVSLRWQ